MTPSDAELLQPGHVVAAMVYTRNPATSPIVWVTVIEPKVRWPYGGGRGGFILCSPTTEGHTTMTAPESTVFLTSGETDQGLVSIGRLNPARGLYRSRARWEVAMAEDRQYRGAAVDWLDQKAAWKARATELLTSWGITDHEPVGRDEAMIVATRPHQLKRLSERLAEYGHHELEIRVPLALIAGPPPEAPRRAS